MSKGLMDAVKEPVMMELVRLRVGDKLAKDHWEIIDETLVYEPNSQVQINALGSVTEGHVNKVIRLKFSAPGSWGGYIFPHTGLAVAVSYNGYSESIVWQRQIDPVQLVIPRDPPVSELCCGI